jgi:hypothetical protein
MTNGLRKMTGGEMGMKLDWVFYGLAISVYFVTIMVMVMITSGINPFLPVFPQLFPLYTTTGWIRLIGVCLGIFTAAGLFAYGVYIKWERAEKPTYCKCCGQVIQGDRV